MLVSTIKNYVKIRQALGADFATSAKILRSFGRTIGDVPLEAITSEQCAVFCRGSSPRKRFKREKHTTLNVFFRFVISRGYLAVSPLPEAPRRTRTDFCPYIYTRDEIKRLLEATTVLCCTKRWRLEPLTLRTIILLLYCTGLRIGEALSLRFCDVDLKKQILTIRDTKFFKSRLVPIGANLCSVLKHYQSVRMGLPLNNEKQTMFFTFRTGKPVSYSSISTAFVKLRKLAGVSRSSSDPWQPRIHDFRATFAVHRLIAWYHEGVNVQTRLPFLATYLGHTGISGTAVYLRMTPELLTEAVKQFEHYAFSRKE